MKIYSFPTFNLTKLLYTAEELSQDYELELFEAPKLQHKTPGHLARHPLGKVPVIEINGKTLFESNAICRLMAELNNNNLYGNTPFERAQVNQWIDYVTQHLLRLLATFAWEEGVSVHYFGNATNTEACIQAQEELNKLLPTVDNQLSQNKFLVRDEITIADTIAFALFQIESFTTLEFSQFKHIEAWYQHMAKRPATQRALDKLPNRAIFGFLAK